MIREIDLVSYLPEFMQAYREPDAALTAENPELQIIWEATDRVLKNRAIATADEYGISRFEKLLGIYPAEDDTLESRRSRIQTRWFNKLPYTLRVLLQKLAVLCGERNFTISNDFGQGYVLTIETNLELYGQVEELENMLDTLLPCNVVADTRNVVSGRITGMLYAQGGVAFAQDIHIISEEENKWQNSVVS